MVFALTFTTDSAAFDDGAAPEAARILRAIADRLENSAISGWAWDINGNRLGTWNLSAMQPDVSDPAPADILAAALS